MENGDLAWIVGEYVDGDNWEVVGIAADEAAAIAACKHDKHFVGPLVVGDFDYAPKSPWPGCRYPLADANGTISGGTMADQDETKEIMDPVTTDQGDGATGSQITNEEAQALVDSGEATPGPQVEDEKEGAAV